MRVLKLDRKDGIIRVIKGFQAIAQEIPGLWGGVLVTQPHPPEDGLEPCRLVAALAVSGNAVMPRCQPIPLLQALLHPACLVRLVVCGRYAGKEAAFGFQDRGQGKLMFYKVVRVEDVPVCASMSRLRTIGILHVFA